MSVIFKAMGSVATGFGTLVVGVFFVPLILFAVAVGLASFLADRLFKKGLCRTVLLLWHNPSVFRNYPQTGT